MVNAFRTTFVQIGSNVEEMNVRIGETQEIAAAARSLAKTADDLHGLITMFRLSES